MMAAAPAFSSGGSLMLFCLFAAFALYDCMIYDPASKKMQSFPNEFVRLLLTRKPKNDSNQHRFWKRTITCSFIIRQEQRNVKVFYFHAFEHH